MTVTNSLHPGILKQGPSKWAQPSEKGPERICSLRFDPRIVCSQLDPLHKSFNQINAYDTDPELTKANSLVCLTIKELRKEGLLSENDQIPCFKKRCVDSEPASGSIEEIPLDDEPRISSKSDLGCAISYIGTKAGLSNQEITIKVNEFIKKKNLRILKQGVYRLLSDPPVTRKRKDPEDPIPVESSK